MPLVVKDRVRETSTTAGTGTFTLAGAVLGYQSFSAIGNGNTTYYTIYLQGGNEWEVGIGTYTASGTTLSRDTILASSNAGSAVNFSAGVKDVFVTYPADRSVWYDSATNVTLNALTLSGGTQNGVLYLNASKVATSGSALTFDGTNLNLGVNGATIYWTAAGNNVAINTSSGILGFYTGTSSYGLAQQINADGTTFWKVGGSEVMRLTSTGLILRQAGTPANTSVSLNTTIQNALTLEADGDLLVGTTTNTNSSKLVASGTISETVSSTQYLVASQFDIGTAPNEIPLNQYLGNLAYQDAGSIAGQVGLSAGTAALPSLVSATDTDTGMWFPAANTLAWSTNGTRAMTVDSSQNVGIGEPNPGVRLDVSGQGRVLYNTGATNTGDQSVVTVGATTSGAYASTYGAGLQFQVINSGGGYAGGRILSRLGADNFTANLVFQARNYGYTDSMTLDASGNLGVGVTSIGAIGSSKLVEIGATTGNSAFLLFNINNARTGTMYSNASETSVGSISATPLLLKTGDTEKARISSDGTFRVKGAGSAGTTDAVQFSGSAPANSLILDSSGVLKENGYAVVSQADIGTAPNEVPLNQYLGTMAYQDGTNYFNTGMTVGFRNRIINGAMLIDQRNAGASVTPTVNSSYLLDRWQYGQNSASGKFSVQQSSTAPSGFTNSILFTSNSAYSLGSSDVQIVGQSIEGLNCADLAWGTSSAKSITISFWVRSSLTGNFGAIVRNADDTRCYPFLYTINSANTWEYKTTVVSGDTTGTWNTNTSIGIRLAFQIGTGSTYSGPPGAWAGTAYYGAAGAVNLTGTNGATLYITGVQLEVGTQATPFDWRPYTTELQLCQRYFQLNGKYTGNNPLTTGFGSVRTGFLYLAYAPHQYLVTMRTAPTITQGGNLVSIRFNGSGYAKDAILTSTGISIENPSPRGASIRFEKASGAWSAGDMLTLCDEDGTGFISFSAEL